MSQKPDKDEEIKRLKKTIAGLVEMLLKTKQNVYITVQGPASKKNIQDVIKNAVYYKPR